MMLKYLTTSVFEMALILPSTSYLAVSCVKQRGSCTISESSASVNLSGSTIANSCTGRAVHERQEQLSQQSVMKRLVPNVSQRPPGCVGSLDSLVQFSSQIPPNLMIGPRSRTSRHTSPCFFGLEIFLAASKEPVPIKLMMRLVVLASIKCPLTCMCSCS